MDPNAYQIIEEHGLPHPTVLSWPAIFSMDATAHVYVRGPRDLPYLNRRIAVGTLRQNISKFRDSTGLISIEESPIITHGGAAYRTSSGCVYAEMCRGHTSGLLRHGFCAGRQFRSILTGNTIFVAEDQRLSILQEDVEDVVVPANSREIESTAEVLDILTRELLAAQPSRHGGTDVLFEWIGSDQFGVQYVDAKEFYDLPLVANFEQIGTRRPVTIEDTLLSSLPTTYFSGSFADQFANIKSSGPYIADVDEQALLSHFFVYSRGVPRRINLVRAGQL